MADSQAGASLLVAVPRSPTKNPGVTSFAVSPVVPPDPSPEIRTISGRWELAQPGSQAARQSAGPRTGMRRGSGYICSWQERHCVAEARSPRASAGTGLRARAVAMQGRNAVVINKYTCRLVGVGTSAVYFHHHHHASVAQLGELVTLASSYAPPAPQAAATTAQHPVLPVPPGMTWPVQAREPSLASGLCLPRSQKSDLMLLHPQFQLQQARGSKIACYCGTGRPIFPLIPSGW